MSLFLNFLIDVEILSLNASIISSIGEAILTKLDQREGTFSSYMI